MSPTCSVCGVATVAFAVPDALRAYAPAESDYAALCPRCLRTYPASSGADAPDFDAVSPAFPDGDGGVAMALLFGVLDSLALNRAAIEALCAYAERAGVDPLLALERLTAVDALDPHFDLPRRHRQLQQQL